MANRTRKNRAGVNRAKGWKRKMEAYDERLRQSNTQHKTHVKTFSKLGIDADGATPKPAAVGKRKRKGVGAAQLRFWLSVPDCVCKRQRGQPGYGTSPATRERA